MASKPIIGVMPLYDDERESIWMLPDYMDGLRAAGAVPVILPLNIDDEEFGLIDGMFDGYLFTGGHDIDPSLYGERNEGKCGVILESRDRLEKMVFDTAYAEDKPMLGICRGLQIINAFLGGTLYQDIPTQRPTDTPHVMTKPYDAAAHNVEIEKDSPLYGLLGIERLGVNSLHHQAIKDISPALNIMAVADDGTIEAFEDRSKRFLWAVQWHPEFSYKTDENSRKIFGAFAKACVKYREGGR